MNQPNKIPNKAQLIHKALILEWILITYNVLEAIASILFGFWAGSIALVGFGFDSVIEVGAASLLVWRLSHKGSLEEETEKEKKALFGVGITFFFLAAYILWEAGGMLFHGEKPQHTSMGILIAILSLLLMPPLAFMKRRIAKQLGSRALEADAMETFICAYLSFILLLGLGFNALCGWWWTDPVAALAMMYFILKEGWEAVREASE